MVGIQKQVFYQTETSLTLNQKIELIKKRASLSKEKNIVTVDCDCFEKRLNGKYYNGAKLELYNNFKEAAFRFQYHTVMRSMFYGIHYKGKHIVGINL
jgi:hypothetical protein